MKKNYFNIIIADSALGDEKDLVRILKTTWLATYPSKELGITKDDILTKDFDSEKKISRWRKTIRTNGKKSKYLCVAKDKDKVVGFSLVSKKKGFNELDVLYILPEYQGTGIGRKLVDRSIDWLGRKKKIFLKVAAHNKNTIGFYEKYGFVKIGVLSKNRLVNGKVMPEAEMTLKLKQIKNLPYRKNVGAVFFKGNKYLLVQLSDGFWKMPQGGVHDGETKKQTLMRELKEELGTDKFKIIKEFPFRHQYNWDEGTLRYTNYRWRGQKQTFFLVEFTGDKITIDKEELKDYKWLTKNELIKAVDSNHPLLKGYKKLVEKLLLEKTSEMDNYASAFIGKDVAISIDRPLGSRHPKHDMIYEVNYGFVPDTKAPDGEEIDAYILGADKPVKEFNGKCIAIVHRVDDNDDKLVVVPEKFREISDEEILKAVNFQEKWFKSVVIRKSK